MSTDPKLEQYLMSLDKALGQIPVSDRADIVTEIKSHVLEAIEREPARGISAVLSSMGEPESVANRYLLERGLKPGKPSRTPVVKWLTVGFLGTFGMILLALMLLIWKFTPLLKVDDKAGRVTILGGLIDVDDKAGTVKIGDSVVENDGYKKFSGTMDVDKAKSKAVHMKFKEGKFDVSTSADGKLHWTCASEGGAGGSFVRFEPYGVVLEMESFVRAKCEIALPAGFSAEIAGNNGKLSILKPAGKYDVEMANGKVSIAPDSAKKYKYDFHVSNGKIDDFESSTAPEAILIKVKLANGMIGRDSR